jgi:hypothetical protein|tara:strand:- start:298 stop:603 length:306 start_codon:yes stop_codon:yes gene_type:complete
MNRVFTLLILFRFLLLAYKPKFFSVISLKERLGAVVKKGYKPKYTPYYFQLEKRIVFDGAVAEAVIDTVAVAADAASAESVQDAIQESIWCLADYDGFNYN